MTAPTSTSRGSNRETPGSALNGWPVLFVLLALVAVEVFLFHGLDSDPHPAGGPVVVELALLIAIIGGGAGLFVLQPNEAAVLTLFGAYCGSVRANGFFWTSPFKAKISLRMRNFNGDKLKVNDKRGNPIEIAAVIVWRVQDTAQALFDVENYAAYVKLQSESALRHVAGSYVYDEGERNEVTLRGGGGEVTAALVAELQESLAKAGVRVEEARLTHLAYAPEIAQAMLRRQQAEAVIAARQKIVAGAVSMVEMALHELTEKGVVTFDDERKASMVSNLLVVLCGESNAQPVINAGTLYG